MVKVGVWQQHFRPFRRRLLCLLGFHQWSRPYCVGRDIPFDEPTHICMVCHRCMATYCAVVQS
jgi:hypothetical protein